MGDELDDAPDIDPDGDFPTSVEAMVAYLKAKVAMPAEEFYGLEEEARARAFTVSGVTELDLISDVWEAIESAVKNGETLEDFRVRIGEKLASEWGGENPSHLETVFRTNVQSAYSAGRFAQNNSPAVRQSHPYSRYDVLDDDRTSEICEKLIGTILPSDSPFVLRHQPPLHQRCRTDVVVITEDEARELGIDEDPPDVQADEGFGDPLADFDPDLTTRPPELVAIYEAKQAG